MKKLHLILEQLMGSYVSLTVQELYNQKELCLNLAPITNQLKTLSLRMTEIHRIRVIIKEKLDIYNSASKLILQIISEVHVTDTGLEVEAVM